MRGKKDATTFPYIYIFPIYIYIYLYTINWHNIRVVKSSKNSLSLHATENEKNKLHYSGWPGPFSSNADLNFTILQYGVSCILPQQYQTFYSF